MWFLCLQLALSFTCLMAALPLVDPGLFVISGVRTCGNGNGYCLLGLDCTLDEDFVPDDLEGHCEGLKYAFTPIAHFVCCKAANVSLDHAMLFPGEESSEEESQNNTTPNEMENEIEQMLLKLAESINAAKLNVSNRPEGSELESGEDSVTVANNGTEGDSENGPEVMTESYEETEEMSGENLTTPDLSGDQAFGENNTNIDAEWLAKLTSNKTVVDNREDIINKVTIKTDLDEINDIVISTLDRNEQVNNVDASFYSIMQKEIENSRENELKNVDANSSVEVLTDVMSGAGYNQSDMNANIDNTETPVESGATTVRPEGQMFQGHYRCEDTHRCASVRFMYENNQVCFGSVLNEEWILTSASCAMRIFRVGVTNITTQRMNTLEEVQLRTIVVHENYREPVAQTLQTIDANDIGLVRIRTPMESWKSCLPCLPYLGQDFSGSNCSALYNYTETSSEPAERSSSGSKEPAMHGASALCDGTAEPLVGEYGDVTYLTLACGSLWRPRENSILNESGSPLVCDGVLAGIETSSGIGTLVYTPVSRYLGWLVDNARSPTQAFHSV